MNSSERFNTITAIRQAATDLVVAIERLQALKQDWIYMDLGNVLDENDFVERHSGLTVADIVAVGATTLTAIEALLAQGHGTNLYKIRIR
jgi:hypothetical protein